MANNVKISYNVNYVRHNIITDITNIIFKWKGIIFGGFVRDAIIANHYRQVFWEKHGYYRYDNKHFWNEKIDKETLPRTLLPSDIDVCLSNESDIDSMMVEITDFINNRFGITNVKIENSVISKDNNEYIDRPSGSLHKFDFNIVVGAIPYITLGEQINISLDVVHSLHRNLMPPFNKLDFICNGFVMTGHNVINLSSHTGTDIDKLKLVEKKEVEFKIIRDIINFKTDYCLQFHNVGGLNIYKSIRYNEQACKRIEKLASKNKRFNMWTIRNMPITIEEQVIKEKNQESCNNCCICCDSIKNKDRTVTLPVFDSNKNMMNGSQMHLDCFFKYLNSQIQNKIADIENDSCDLTFLRCPLRNNIDFNCKNIKDIIKRYLEK